MPSKFGNILNSDRAPSDDVAAQPEQLLSQAVALHQDGQLAQALALYKQMLALQPGNFDALHLSGVIAYQTNDPELAVELIERAIEINPNDAAAYFNCGLTLQNLKRNEAALQSYDRAIALNPDLATAHYNRGSVLNALKKHDAAIQSYDRAIALKPDYAEAYYNRGNALNALRKHEAAIQSYDRAIALKPDYAEAYHNRGSALQDIKRHQAALESYDKAILLKPDFADALNNRGGALKDLKQFQAAIVSYDKAIALKPDYPFLYGMRLHTKMQICDWVDVENQFAQLARRLEREERVSPPFPVLAITGSLALQRKAAEIWVRENCPPSNALPRLPKHSRHDRIRIGYFSADFRTHAVSILTAELFERHDKSRFEMIAFSYGSDSNDEMRNRAVAAFDRFIDVRAQSDKDVAQLARKLEVDIAIDLGGFTQDRRTDIFAMRAAPIQASYIGYLGTMGAEYIDYLIADGTVIPKEHQEYYSEKIVYLPSYQANDSKRRIADKRFTREELGLPQTGFVFCCFNNNFKITPDTFDGWMRVLKAVEASVLFLYADNGLAADNLRKEATSRGVEADRLIFGNQLPVPEYLARYRIADLFLDTLPYNAGATASDALWAGLPVLTRVGEAFAGRVAASLLNAIHLPELITATQQEYEELAIELATHPERLAQIKQKLADNRLTTPLFDTELFTRNMEAAYTEMYDRYQADLPPGHIHVQA